MLNTTPPSAAANVPAPDLYSARQMLLALDPDAHAQFGFRSISDRGDGPAVLYYGDLDCGVRQSRDPEKNGRPCSPASRLMFLQHLGNGAFFTPNVLDGQGQAAANVVVIRTAYIDADTASAVERLHRFIAGSGLTPTALVASGGVDNGAEKQHAYWRLNGCPVAEFTTGQLTLISRIGSDPAVQDVGHVMRLPGFWHLKREPRQTRILSIAPGVEYAYAEFMARVLAQPQFCDPWGGRTARFTATRRGATTGGIAAPSARLRVLVDQYGGLLPSATRALLREAVAPTENSPGNRHSTLQAAVARLIGVQWSDDDARALLLPIVNGEWGDGNWAEHLDQIIDWTRKRQDEALAAPTAPSAVARAFGSDRAQ